MKMINKLVLVVSLILTSSFAFAGTAVGTIISYGVESYDNDGEGGGQSVSYALVSINDPNNDGNPSAECALGYMGYTVIAIRLEGSTSGQAEYSAIMAASATGSTVAVNYSINAVGNCEVVENGSSSDGLIVIN